MIDETGKESEKRENDDRALYLGSDTVTIGDISLTSRYFLCDELATLIIRLLRDEHILKYLHVFQSTRLKPAFTE